MKTSGCDERRRDQRSTNFIDTRTCCLIVQASVQHVGGIRACFCHFPNQRRLSVSLIGSLILIRGKSSLSTQQQHTLRCVLLPHRETESRSPFSELELCLFNARSLSRNLPAIFSLNGLVPTSFENGNLLAP